MGDRGVIAERRKRGKMGRIERKGGGRGGGTQPPTAKAWRVRGKKASLWSITFGFYLHTLHMRVS